MKIIIEKDLYFEFIGSNKQKEEFDEISNMLETSIISCKKISDKMFFISAKKIDLMLQNDPVDFILKLNNLLSNNCMKTNYKSVYCDHFGDFHLSTKNIFKIKDVVDSNLEHCFVSPE